MSRRGWRASIVIASAAKQSPCAGDREIASSLRASLGPNLTREIFNPSGPLWRHRVMRETDVVFRTSRDHF
jgi:hypothetical protein